MSRNNLLFFVLSIAPVAGGWLTAQYSANATVRAAEAELPAGAAGVEIAGLKDTLEKGLKARLPNEFEFIARVVQLVEANVLPYRLVYISFKYARNRHPKWPFVYFEASLRRLAAEENIEI